MGGADATNTNDDPEHVVRIAPFFLDRLEVCNWRWRACVTAGGCTPPERPNATYLTEDRFPIDGVTYYQAMAFCAWDGKRLPTEAEWEYAARGPIPSRNYWPWGNTVATCLEANVAGCFSTWTWENVGSHPAGASPFGVEDMAGGNWEFVADIYAAGYYSVSPSFDPRGPASGPYISAPQIGRWRFLLKCPSESSPSTG